jgi:PhnB protein
VNQTVQQPHVSTYLNFERNTEEAFTFYKSVFGTEFLGPIMRHGDVPVAEGEEGPSEENKNLVINVALPILGGHILMGTDAGESVLGIPLTMGNNVHIALHPDSREEADRLFAALSEGGTIEMEMQDMFWGDYYGAFTDKYGVHWMINHSSQG